MDIRCENLTAGYGDKRILDGLSVTLPAGQITALLGPNGCGKSTLLKCLARLLIPQSGTLHIAGKPLSAFSPRALSRHLALLPQQHMTPDHRAGTGQLWPQPVAAAVGAAFSRRPSACQPGNGADAH